MLTLQEFTQSLRVLVVEDDDSIRTQLVKIFKRRFKNVEEACNGQEAFIKYDEAKKSGLKFDVIFSDICMPQSDGLSLLKNIRVEDKETAVLFISARNESHLLLEAITYGVNGYLIKPINYDLMTLKIKEISTTLYYKFLYEQKKQECEQYISMIKKENISMTREDKK